MVFHVYTVYCDINMRDVARLEKSVTKTQAARRVFFSFSKVGQHPKCLYFFYKITRRPKLQKSLTSLLEKGDEVENSHEIYQQPIRVRSIITPQHP